MAKKKIIALSLVLCLIVAAYFPLKAGYAFMIKQREFSRRRACWSELGERIKKEIVGFNGRAGIIIEDLNTGCRLEVNADALFPAASLLKIPIAVSYFYAANEGKISLDEVLTLKTSDKVGGSGGIKELPDGTQFTLKRLIELMISESDNTAANMLIERLGQNYLNKCFKKIGLGRTNICRAMMDFKSRRQGRENFITASDLAYLLDEAYHKKLISKNYSQLLLKYLKEQKIRDRIPRRLPVTTLVAHKTGLERRICHDAGIVFTPKGDFMICVLTRHRGKTAKPAKIFISRIAFLVYDFFS